MKGEMNAAPAFAARRACPAEKHNVTFTIVPSSESSLQVLIPAGVRGTLTATLSLIFLRTSASLRIVS